MSKRRKFSAEFKRGINGDALDEGPATGRGPAQVMWDAHASVSSACFLLSH